MTGAAEDIFFQLDAEEILNRINSGEAPDEEEVEAIVATLELVKVERDYVRGDTGTITLGSGKLAQVRMPGVDETYSLIKVMGRANLKDHRGVLESFLKHEDPLTVSLVMEILCLNWELTEDYLEQVVNFALGVAWDEEYDVADTAIRVLGEFLASGKKSGPEAPQVKKLISELFEDKKSDHWIRQRCYFSMLRASGKAWEEIPSECCLIEFSRDNSEVQWTVIDQFKE